VIAGRGKIRTAIRRNEIHLLAYFFHPAMPGPELNGRSDHLRPAPAPTGIRHAERYAISQIRGLTTVCKKPPHARPIGRGTSPNC